MVKACKQRVKVTLKASVIDLTNGGGFEEIRQFQQYLSYYKIIGFDGLHPHMVIVNGISLSDKKLYLLYNRESGHYNVITSLKGATAKSTYVPVRTLQ
jgi:hypothetical protein